MGCVSWKECQTPIDVSDTRLLTRMTSRAHFPATLHALTTFAALNFGEMGCYEIRVSKDSSLRDGYVAVKMIDVVNRWLPKRSSVDGQGAFPRAEASIQGGPL